MKPWRDNRITLVIDDGPSDATETMLSRLEATGHRAVLFVIGSNLEGYEHLLVGALRRGFALGNHSWQHGHFSTMDAGEGRVSIERTEDAIEAIYGSAGVKRPGKWFRFPYLDAGGERSREFQELLREMGFERPENIGAQIQDTDRERLDWTSTLCTLDWALPSENALRRLVRKARPGEILEFHDKPDTVSRYMDAVIEELGRLSLRAKLPRTGGLWR